VLRPDEEQPDEEAGMTEPVRTEQDGAAQAARRFRDVLGAFASGVTVVTTSGDRVPAHGTTVSAFASLSLDPPLVLVCLSSTSRARALLEQAGAFTVNVLSAGQAGLSRRFAAADRPSGEALFDGVLVRAGATGCPVLVGAAAHVDCRVVVLHEGGDHVVVVGEVVGVAHDEEQLPLLVHRGRYRLLGAEPQDALPSRTLRAA
jgi:3-hydroxy-9,10-secoandrosta-1,3,5(10)-triene-9,17-dione monooxygenase reductase component